MLGLTPSAVSHAVSSLEAELGFCVLNRAKSGVTLTNYGERLLPYVNAVLNSDESLQQAISEFNGLKQGKKAKVWDVFPVSGNVVDSGADSFFP